MYMCISSYTIYLHIHIFIFISISIYTIPIYLFNIVVSTFRFLTLFIHTYTYTHTTIYKSTLYQTYSLWYSINIFKSVWQLLNVSISHTSSTNTMVIYIREECERFYLFILNHPHIYIITNSINLQNIFSKSLPTNKYTKFL